MLVTLVIAAAAGALVYFTIRWAGLRRGYQAMSRAEQRRAEILGHRQESVKVRPHTRLRNHMQRLGLGESVLPFYAAALVVYLAAAAPLTLLGAPTFLGLLGAAPLSMLGGYLFVSVRAARTRASFNRQLIDLLDQLAAQIKSGVGAERALQIVVPQMPHPLQDEMARVLNASAAGADIIEALKALAERYPSRAFSMFISAIEIDRAEGHAIAPALEQAAALLKQQFSLASEARAEVSQIRSEFYIVASIIIGLGLFLVFGSDSETSDAYRSFGGVLAAVIAGANIGVGFWRFQRILATLKGDT